MNQLAKALGERLSERSETVSVAESCTAGGLACVITRVPGASAYFIGGIIAYDNAVKSGILEVSPDVLQQFGAVSSEVASAMATSCRRIFETDFAVSITGIAGPSGGTPEKPVGRVFVAVAWKDGVRGVRLDLQGDRDRIRAQAVEAALELALSAVSNVESS
jgi:PncC family amidohydrolase